MKYFEVPGCQPGIQYDAHDCLIKFLDVIYPVLNNHFMFRYNVHESIECQIRNCRSAIVNNVSEIILTLELEDTANMELITGLLQTMMNFVSRVVLDYKCDRCEREGICTKAYFVTFIWGFFIIQLNMLKFTKGYCHKLVPNLQI